MIIFLSQFLHDIHSNIFGSHCLTEIVVFFHQRHHRTFTFYYSISDSLFILNENKSSQGFFFIDHNKE